MLSGGLEYVAIAATGAFILLSGLVILWARSTLEGSAGKQHAHQGANAAKRRTSPDRTLVRSWLAVALVGALIILCAVSFGLPDDTLRSSLVGGLVASSGAAVAFYFASKSAEQARADILAASTPLVHIPKLTDMKRSDVNAALAALPLTLVCDPLDAEPDAVSIKQAPDANTVAPAHSVVTVTFPKPAGTQPSASAASASTTDGRSQPSAS